MSAGRAGDRRPRRRVRRAPRGGRPTPPPRRSPPSPGRRRCSAPGGGARRSARRAAARGRAVPRAPTRARPTSRDGARHRPHGVEGRAERIDAVDRDGPSRVFRPTSSHAAAGSRTEQPVSVPIPRSQRPAAIAAALPLDEPPVVRPGRAGLWTVPYHSFPPRTPQANSTRFALPRIVAPASSTRCDDGRVALGDVVGVDARAVGRPDPGRVDQVLDEERAPRERPLRRARPQRLVEPGDPGVPRSSAIALTTGSARRPRPRCGRRGSRARRPRRGSRRAASSPKTSWRTGFTSGRSRCP